VNAFLQHLDGLSSGTRQPLTSFADRSILDEASFQRMLSLETKRALRSQKPFVLCLFKVESSLGTAKMRDTLHNILNVLDLNTRETDITGWYRKEMVLGVMFIEIAIGDRTSIETAILSRINSKLRAHLSRQQFSQLEIACHHFPETQSPEKIVTPDSEQEHSLSESEMPHHDVLLTVPEGTLAAQNIRS
jgi:hypothetical protein